MLIHRCTRFSASFSGGHRAKGQKTIVFAVFNIDSRELQPRQSSW